MIKEKTINEAVPRPVFHNVSDVLRYASGMIRHMANQQKMMEIISEVLDGKRDLVEKAPDEVKIALIEPAKQAVALNKAADLLFDLAAEHKALELSERHRK